MAEVEYCDLTLSGIQRDCTGSIGGVGAIAISPAKDVKDITFDEDGIVTAITPTVTAAKPFKNYYTKKATAVYNTTFTVSETSDGLHQNDLVFQIQKMKAQHRSEYLKLVSGETIALFRDNNGLWKLLGTPMLPATGTAGDGTTGQALTDYNGYNVTLSTTDRVDCPEVDPEAALLVIEDSTTTTP